MSQSTDNNLRPQPDEVLVDIANYVADFTIESSEAIETARYCLMDGLGCGFLALRYPECAKHLGPVVPGTSVPFGSRVPGTQFELDPIKAAFDIGCTIRWLDYNDTWLAAEWGHPSDNLGAILAVADFISRQNVVAGYDPLTMTDVIKAMIKAHEIQGVLALENSFNRVGIDHVVLVKVASAAVATHLMGGGKEEIIDVLSQVFVDGQSLRTYRQSPNTGARKSWAAGDATSRAVRLATITMTGEMGYPSALTAKEYGFYDVSFKGNSFAFQREYGTYVMENILFKLAYPAEFHGQTAVECALQLHDEVIEKLDKIDRIHITTNESAIRIISKAGALNNPADRDHCLQYMVAVALLTGELTADHYEDDFASQPIIDELRMKITVEEEERYSKDYHDPDKRSIANAIQVFYNDGTSSEKIEVEYPVGHKQRREEGIPLLIEKFDRNVSTRFPKKHAEQIVSLCLDADEFLDTPVNEFMDLLVI